MKRNALFIVAMLSFSLLSFGQTERPGRAIKKKIRTEGINFRGKHIGKQVEQPGNAVKFTPKSPTRIDRMKE